MPAQQRFANLLARLAHAGKNDALDRELPARCKPIQFAAGHNVKSAAQRRDSKPQDGKIASWPLRSSKACAAAPERTIEKLVKRWLDRSRRCRHTRECRRARQSAPATTPSHVQLAPSRQENPGV